MLNYLERYLLPAQIRHPNTTRLTKPPLTTLVKKFDHRIFQVFERKDTTVGLSLLTKPSPLKTKKIVQVPTVGDQSILIGVEKEAIDTDSEDFLEYQLELKQYVSDNSRYNSDLQKCFSMIMGQCSPAVE